MSTEESRKSWADELAAMSARAKEISDTLSKLALGFDGDAPVPEPGMRITLEDLVLQAVDESDMDAWGRVAYALEMEGPPDTRDADNVSADMYVIRKFQSMRKRIELQTGERETPPMIASPEDVKLLDAIYQWLQTPAEFIDLIALCQDWRETWGMRRKQRERRGPIPDPEA